MLTREKDRLRSKQGESFEIDSSGCLAAELIFDESQVGEADIFEHAGSRYPHGAGSGGKTSAKSEILLASGDLFL